MPIQESAKILYQDMVDMVMTTIKSQCQNIDSISSDLPEYLRPGGSYSVTGYVWTTGNDPHTGGGSNTFNPEQKQTRATFTVNDSMLHVVSSDIVQRQFDSFMTSRGIASKSTTPMTMRGIINFIANAATFIRARVLRVGGNGTDEIATYYNDGNVTYENITSDNSSASLDDYMKLNADELVKALNHVQSYHSIVYSISVSCCSSSSSSCSSSCSSSSSSSSSSSVFIAYMRI